MTVKPENDLVAIGQLASRVGKPVRAIEQVAEEMQLPPAMRINLVPFYDGRQVEQITTALAQRSK